MILHQILMLVHNHQSDSQLLVTCMKLDYMSCCKYISTIYSWGNLCFVWPMHRLQCKNHIFQIVGWLSVKKGPFCYTADKSVKNFPLIPWHVNISLRTGSTKMRKLTKLHTYFHQLK